MSDRSIHITANPGAINIVIPVEIIDILIKTHPDVNIVMTNRDIFIDNILDEIRCNILDDSNTSLIHQLLNESILIAAGYSTGATQTFKSWKK